MKLIEANPLSGIEALKDPTARPIVRWLTVEEEARLMAALERRESRLRPLVVLALHTGARRGELLTLEWRDIDIEQGTLTIRPECAKNGKERHIPLNAPRATCSAAWRAGSHWYRACVFPSTKTGGVISTFNAAWWALLKAAQVEGFRFHDLRHTFASELVMAGADLNVVRELFGAFEHSNGAENTPTFRPA